MSFAPSRRHLLALLGAASGSAVLAACGEGGSGSGGKPTVVAACYPMEYLATRVAGDHIDMIQLATPGADAHGLELSVKQTLEIRKAALVLQIPGLTTALDDAIASEGTDNVLDVSSVVTLLASSGEDEHEHEHEDGTSDEGGEEHDLAGDDPHLWHDPQRMADIGDAIAKRLGEQLPDVAEELTANAATLRSDLEALDTELEEDFSSVSGNRTFITSHTAFAYLADRYDLHQVGISGVDPETEPSPQRLLQLEQVVKDEEVTTIFFETTASPKVAQTLAENVGVTAAELDNLETQLSEDQDYPAVMRSNAKALMASWS
ncbi:metal ABC transporter substrate-binding protein [Brachybacterium sp. SGAir0954]|uniref:metal ABC transporter substrate-binding protein n=1 Tax=Brachybacterium sp. SGAir0954 TaxID=2571029 RepID=UPI00143DA742|nr:metal ABC transporter substrate-binding protein [Brachybacterium sp. SGAir0954]